ncbi:proline-rich receptor-like protein kinase PERK2 [Iris pallida]|uniref:Proline-rich receptor-like protein kinase PERK2 n=1 Tax=Iris pallida TaxID=29817 RepID=A0AAX6GXT4_IRIPA|nr:proline-rich receptor-like protein kinase PERK2 [Iris pallida]
MGATFAFSLLPLNYYSPSLSHFFSSYNKNSNSINPTHHSMLEPHPPLAMAGPPPSPGRRPWSHHSSHLLLLLLLLPLHSSS